VSCRRTGVAAGSNPLKIILMIVGAAAVLGSGVAIAYAKSKK
jgi:hypothetical protein